MCIIRALAERTARVVIIIVRRYYHYGEIHVVNRPLSPVVSPLLSLLFFFPPFFLPPPFCPPFNRISRSEKYSAPSPFSPFNPLVPPLIMVVLARRHFVPSSPISRWIVSVYSVRRYFSMLLHGYRSLLYRSRLFVSVRLFNIYYSLFLLCHSRHYKYSYTTRSFFCN